MSGLELTVGSRAPPNDDSDLEDLLAADGTDVRIPNSSNRSSGVSVLPLLGAHCSYLCYTHPKFCSCFAVLAIFFVMVLLANAVFNPTETFGQIQSDLTNINSQYDLSMGKIDHWCIKGDNDSCRCADPLQPQSRLEFKSWGKAAKQNIKTVKALEGKTVDVAFLGESLVEEMDGRWMGREPQNLAKIAKIFRKHFTKELGDIEGVALGIAGDTSSNVLWRLLNGEMPDSFQPKIWWLSLGMNDLGRMQCSEEVVLLGILRVVEEIRAKRPHAKIIINSIIPMANMRGGINPHRKDYEDAFKKYKGHPVNRLTSTKSQVSVTQGTDSMTKEEIKRWKKRVRKDAFNPSLNNKHNMKKYDAKSMFMTQNQVPLWTAIKAINEELRKFSAKHDHISYFDVTDTFAERKDGDNYVLLSKMVSARGHPTELGYKVWEDNVAEKIKKILGKSETEDETEDESEEYESSEESEGSSE